MNWNGSMRFGWSSLVFWLAAGPVAAQFERSELGKRLQRFEVQWQQAVAEARAASAQPMQQAVSSFFSLRMERALEKLDEAWCSAAGREPSAWHAAVAAHRITLEPLVVAASAAELSVKFEPAYRVPVAASVEAEVEFLISRAPRARTAAIHPPNQQKNPVPAVPADTDALTPLRTCSWREAIAGVKLPIGDLAEGDYLVHARMTEGEQCFELLPSGWSRIREPGERTQAIQDAAGDLQHEMPAWLRATLADHARLLRRLTAGQLQEIDYPAHQILRLCEQAVADPDEAAKLFFERARCEDLWMTAARQGRQVPLRIRCPSGPLDLPLRGCVFSQPLPVLLLFHGAGGSENMFFETYGAGGAVAAGLERNWLVVATRQGWTGLSLDAAQLLDQLEELFPIDRSKVLLMGHSMGAGQVATQVGLHPRLPRAVAALGGGRPRNPESVASLPWFVAAGSLDFGRSGAVSLSQNLKRAGGQRVVYREYPDVEHMVIVQAALPDVFDFFDAALRDQQPQPPLTLRRDKKASVLGNP
jgi:pimeloyl-ACP methyl ester carboxylesterase